MVGGVEVRVATVCVIAFGNPYWEVQPSTCWRQPFEAEEVLRVLSWAAFHKRNDHEIRNRTTLKMAAAGCKLETVASPWETVMSKRKERSKVAVEFAGIAETPTGPAAAAAALDQDCNQDEVAVLAYQMWQERGCPIGSDQEDWFRGENELNNRRVLAAGASSTADTTVS